MTRTASSKLVPRSRLAALGERARRADRRLVFTNGCFDLMHPGHVALLEAARRQGDLLVVAINSDASVRRLKGPDRPLMSQGDRAYMLGALECVDHVTVFGEQTPLKAIELLRPAVLVKGADWKMAAIVGREEVEADGGRVVRVTLKGGFSTTKMLDRLRRG
jgi:D-beta-D-heptose 7-phosphate kinase/D-beta-D-heptose 1-phosphate adenosyltransferase